MIQTGIEWIEKRNGTAVRSPGKPYRSINFYDPLEIPKKMGIYQTPYFPTWESTKMIK